MNVEGARLAKAAAVEWTAKTPDQPRFAAGSMGPMNRTLSISPDVNDPSFRGMTFDQAREAYEEQVRGLHRRRRRPAAARDHLRHAQRQGGDRRDRERLRGAGRPPAADDLGDDHRSAAAAPSRARRSTRSTSRSGTPGRSASASTARSAPATCGRTSPSSRQMAECYVSVYPNAGLPNAFGEYDELPEETGALLRDFVASGFANIVGGCCGTTPDHIAAVRKAVEGLAPRALPAELVAAGFRRQAGSRVRASGSRGQRRTLLPVLRPRDADHPARQQLPDDRRAHQRHRLGQVRPADQERQLRRSGARRGGAGPRRRQPDRRQHGRRHARLRAGHDHVPQLHRDRARDRPRAGDGRQLEVVGDRGRAQVRAGQERRQLDQPEGRRGRLPAQGQADPALRRRRRRHGLRRGRARPTPFERKVEICQRAYKLLVEQAGFDPTDIIFDPNILAIATGLEEHNDYAVNFIEATRLIKATCPGVKISGGVSNLSFSFRGNDIVREAMHSAFLFHAIKAGMDMGIVNAGQLVVYEDIGKDAARARRGRDLQPPARRDRAAGAVRRHRQGRRQEARRGSRMARGAASQQRLSYALVHGVVDFIEPTSRKRASSTRSRSRSSRGR